MSTRRVVWTKFAQRQHLAESSSKGTYLLLGLSILLSLHQLGRYNYAAHVQYWWYYFYRIILDSGGVLSLTPPEWHTGQEQDRISHYGATAGELDPPFWSACQTTLGWKGGIFYEFHAKSYATTYIILGSYGIIYRSSLYMYVKRTDYYKKV